MKATNILAIDTSCDDTAAAVTCGWEVWSNVIASQTELHKPYGGVFPTVAKQAHKENIAPTVALALRRASMHWQDIDAIAVTQGPGLAPALEVGIAYATKMAQKYNLPLIPINHIEGHLLSALAKPKPKKQSSQATTPHFPALGVVVSGGHTEFVLIKSFGEYSILGKTIDDAAGEALDKVGRMINLGYPAGPIIEQFAKKGNPHAYAFPLPMTTSGNYNVSFSGLKTFSRNLVSDLESQNKLHSKQAVYDFAASFQHAVFRHINHKLAKILDAHPTITQIWLGGGVAANIALRKSIRQTIRKNTLKLKNNGFAARHSRTSASSKQISLLTPYTKRLCQDNAAMIGVVAGGTLYTPHSDIIPAKYKREKFKYTIDRKPRLSLDTK